jgi:hypothetical protein
MISAASNAVIESTAVAARLTPRSRDRNDNQQGANNGHRSIHSTNDPRPSVTAMTRKTRSLRYINLAPARASSTDA